MRPTVSKTSPKPSYPELPESSDRAVPTFIATDLLEKLITDRDAWAVDRVITTSRRH